MAIADATKRAPISVGGQDYHVEETGAHIRDISAEMVVDAGARHVIVGHSEQRRDYHETNALVKTKSLARRRAGLVTIPCVEQREARHALRVIRDQVRGVVDKTANAGNTAIAYEPVWAIGSAQTAMTENVAEVHREIRHVLSAIVGKEEAAYMKILYSGSVNPSNATEFMTLDDVDWALVGGTSLRSDDFLAIAGACCPS